MRQTGLVTAPVQFVVMRSGEIPSWFTPRNCGQSAPTQAEPSEMSKSETPLARGTLRNVPSAIIRNVTYHPQTPSLCKPLTRSKVTRHGSFNLATWNDDEKSCLVVAHKEHRGMHRRFLIMPGLLL